MNDQRRIDYKFYSKHPHHWYPRNAWRNSPCRFSGGFKYLPGKSHESFRKAPLWIYCPYGGWSWNRWKIRLIIPFPENRSEKNLQRNGIRRTSRYARNYGWRWSRRYSKWVWWRPKRWNDRTSLLWSWDCRWNHGNGVHFITRNYDYWWSSKTYETNFTKWGNPILYLCSRQTQYP